MKRVAFVLLVIVFLLVAWQTLARIYAGVHVSREVAVVQQNVADLQQQNSELLKLLQYVKSPAFAEREARLRFGLAKPGEKEIVVTPSGGDGLVRSASSAPQEKPSNPLLWWKYFVGE